VSNPLHAAYYADRAQQATVTVVENLKIARDTFRVRFECPEIARQIVPGQFLMLRLAGFDDPLLGRPLALYDTVPSTTGEPIGIDVVYLVMGKMTRKLALFAPGQRLEVWGPLGNGFAKPQTAGEHLVMVAGGIGQTPFMGVAREALGLRHYGVTGRSGAAAGRVTLCYGARSSEFLAGVEDFQELGVDVRLSTDDGTAGHHGLVTDLLRQVLAESPRARVVCCGPEPMMEAVAEVAQHAQVPCQVSLETPMACGIGICFSCVARVRDESGEWDYKRTCVEGPVLEAGKIAW
jgi:dihydroorotate dehydrogenase electron transfer subunit